MNPADSYRRQIPPGQVRQHRLFACRGQSPDHPLTSRITRDVRERRHRRPDCRLPPLPVWVARSVPWPQRMHIRRNPSAVSQRRVLLLGVGAGRNVAENPARDLDATRPKGALFKLQRLESSEPEKLLGDSLRRARHALQPRRGNNGGRSDRTCQWSRHRSAPSCHTP